MDSSANLENATHCMGLFSPLPPSQVISASAFISTSNNFVFGLTFTFSTVMGLGDMVGGHHETEMCITAESECALFSYMFKRQLI